MASQTELEKLEAEIESAGQAADTTEDAAPETEDAAPETENPAGASSSDLVPPQQESVALVSPAGDQLVQDPGDLKPQTSSDVSDPWRLLVAKDVKELTKEAVFFNRDVVSRLTRYSMTILVPVVLLCILYAVTNEGIGTDDSHWISRMVGISIAFLFTAYFASLGNQIYPGMKRVDDAYLFKVRTRFSTVPDWASMRIANTQLLHLYRPIQSISEFSAISGGLANQMLATLGPFTWVMVVMLFAAEMQCDNDYQFQIAASDVLILIGAGGIIMIGMFELNHYDRAMVTFHYVGVVMAIAILVAGIIQGVALSNIRGKGHFLAVPILLNSVAWPCFLYWQYISRESNAEQFENELKAHQNEHGHVDEEFMTELKRKINRMSVKCIVLEGIAIYSITMAFAWYIGNWGEYCARDCDGQWYCSSYCTFNYLGDD